MLKKLHSISSSTLPVTLSTTNGSKAVFNMMANSAIQSRFNHQAAAIVVDEKKVQSNRPPQKQSGAPANNKFISKQHKKEKFQELNLEKKARLDNIINDQKSKQKLGKRILLYLMRCSQKNIPITTVYFYFDLLLNHLKITMEHSFFIQLLSLCKDEDQCVTVFLLSVKAEKVKLENGTESIEPIIKLPKNISYNREQYEKFRSLMPLNQHYNEVMISTALFHTLARLKSKYTYALFRALKQSDESLFSEYHTVECYNCLLLQYAKPPFTDMELVNKLLSEMNQNEATKPNIRTHTLLLDLILKSTYSNGEKLQRILQMTREIESADTAFFNKLLTNLIDTQQYKIAIQLFNAINQASVGTDSKIRPDRVTYHKMISLYFKIGSPEKALSIAKAFEQDPLSQITSYTCCLVIQGFIDADRIQEAIMLYENFIKHPKIKLDQIFFNAIISSAGKKNLPQLLQRAIKDMKELKVEPDLTLYFTTLSSYSRMGLMPEAEKMYQLFKVKGLLTSSKHYTALMRGYFRLKKDDMVWDVFQRFLEDQKLREKSGDPLYLDFAILSYLLAATRSKEQLEQIFVHYKALIEKNIISDSTNDYVMLDDEAEDDIILNITEAEDDEKVGAFTDRDLVDLYNDDFKFEESGKIAFYSDVRPELFYYRLCRVSLYQRHTNILIQLLNHMQLIAKVQPHSIKYFSKIVLRYLSTTGRKRVVYFFEVLDKLLQEYKKGTRIVFLEILARKYLGAVEKLADFITQQRIENYIRYRGEDLQDPSFNYVPNFNQILKELATIKV
ncbi:predicted protein [Naegleria gruberi]|uniref:Predicted protein n=1 Tax=Naegleria gruberi TaxID=5762 RepID=D2VKD9_NAEGR|nr:uncharacterized protein NAEGRDRAFT_50270 [Naegleria gruberi]EFC42582.1 predicted protein [Naegleria gruberi]|eukprot:XP_002675326.1 predicted protein [Naegleria gruberi strain NEG-M]